MSFEIFLAGQPGLEPLLVEEARALGFAKPRVTPGGVAFDGDWADVWRANMWCRGAGRVLARVGGFPVFHLAQLDKRARKFDWAGLLRPDVPVRVEVTCKRSKIYHAKAAAQRIEGAIAAQAPLDPKANLRVLARIEDNFCTFSVDTSGAALHQRGHKEWVGKAPMRETLAALFLRACGYDGSQMVVDPMCGSGTFLLEAAEIAAGLAPGRGRAFAMEDLASFDPDICPRPEALDVHADAARFFGSDRDAGAIKGAEANAARAGVAPLCRFTKAAFSDLVRPEGAPGIVMVNPPYGARIGNRKLLFGLYGSLGEVMRSRFGGWRFGMVTSDGGLAKATGLALEAGPPVSFGGLKVKLYQAQL